MNLEIQRLLLVMFIFKTVTFHCGEICLTTVAIFYFIFLLCVVIMVYCNSDMQLCIWMCFQVIGSQQHQIVFSNFP